MYSIVILGSTISALGVARDAHSLGLAATIFDTQSGPAAKTRFARSQIVTSSDETECLAHLKGLGGNRSALIATEDRWLRFLVRYRGEIQRAYTQVLHPGDDALRICLDKRRFSAWCQENTLPSPRCWSVEEACGGTPSRYPLLLRPAYTVHDRPALRIPKAVQVGSRDELIGWLDKYSSAGITPLITESLLQQRLTQYSVPIARSDGQMISFVARKVRPPADWCRGGTYVELAPSPGVEQLARQAAQRLDFFGIGEIEVLRAEDSGKNYLIEVNARPWLQYSLGIRSGRSLLGFVLGRRTVEGPMPRSEGIRWIDLTSDLYVCLSRSDGILWRGEIGLYEYLKSLLKANAYARFDVRDWRPFLAGFGDLGAMFRRELPGTR